MNSPSDEPGEFPDAQEEDALRSANDHFLQGFFGIADASRGFLEPTILPELSECLDWEKWTPRVPSVPFQLTAAGPR